MKPILMGFAAAAFVGSLVTVAAADPNCTCRARDVKATLGETVCIRTPKGLQLARCEMVLNNTSWTFLDAPCPQAMLDPSADTRTTQSSAASYPIIQ